MSYNKKCKGCGGYLTDDQTSPSYVPKFDPEKTQYCYRCFRLKNYNETNFTEQSKLQVKNIISQLNFDYAMVFLICDVLDLEHTLFKLPPSAKNICIVVNKMDLLPSDVNYERTCEQIAKNIDAKDLGQSSIIFATTKSKSSLARLEEQIYATRKMKQLFVGKSNVGKSSLINAMLKRCGITPTLTCSATINTTLNLQKIKFPRYEIIDTPGFITDENILNFIAREHEKKIFNHDELKPIVFQIAVPKTLCIENLVQINITPVENKIGSVICYMNNQLNITTCKLTNEDKLVYPERINYNIKDVYWQREIHEFGEERMNLCIAGLGMVTFKNIKNCEIRFLAKLGVKLMKFSIV